MNGKLSVLEAGWQKLEPDTCEILYYFIGGCPNGSKYLFRPFVVTGASCLVSLTKNK